MVKWIPKETTTLQFEEGDGWDNNNLIGMYLAATVSEKHSLIQLLKQIDPKTIETTPNSFLESKGYIRWWKIEIWSKYGVVLFAQDDNILGTDMGELQVDFEDQYGESLCYMRWKIIDDEKVIKIWVCNGYTLTDAYKRLEDFI